MRNEGHIAPAVFAPPCTHLYPPPQAHLVLCSYPPVYPSYLLALICSCCCCCHTRNPLVQALPSFVSPHSCLNSSILACVFVALHLHLFLCAHVFCGCIHYSMLMFVVLHLHLLLHVCLHCICITWQTKHS